MDDHRAQFITLLGDACAAAATARIEVEIGLADGSHVRGVPRPIPTTDSREEVDDTGYAQRLFIGDESVAMTDIHSFTVANGR